MQKIEQAIFYRVLGDDSAYKIKVAAVVGEGKRHRRFR